MLNLVPVTLLKYCFGRYPAPMSLTLGLTGECQCDCLHCGISYMRSGHTLSLSMVTEILEQYRSLGGVRVIFSGGEPLLVRELPQMVSRAARLGLVTGVDSNGIALTSDLARRLKEAGICCLEFSLDFLDSPRMDYNRRYEGALAAVLRAMDLARRWEIPFSINSMAFRENLDGELERIIRFAREQGALFVRILEPISTGCLKDQQAMALEPQERIKYLALYEPGFVMLEQVGRFTSDCSGLNGRCLTVCPDGSVTPCAYMPLPLGNLRQESLSSILQKVARLALEARTDCQLEERTCPVNDACFRERFISEVAPESRSA